ncbi:unnamed protein product, partial [Closterium sp. Naga37s-1]
MEAGTAQVGRRLGASRGAGRTQRALQADQYEAAQELREKIAEIDREDSFSLSSPSPSPCPSPLRLPPIPLSAQRALQADQYEAAQELREKIAEIDRETVSPFPPLPPSPCPSPLRLPPIPLSAQRALQADQYEAAQELREKIAEIDRETARQRDAKAAISFASAAPPSPIPCANHAAAPTAAPSAAPSAVPSAALSAAPASFYAITFPHPYFSACPLCREELQQAAYGGKTGEGEGEVKAVRCRFQLGQRVQHCRHAYDAVVVGVDPVCCESAEWMAAADVAGLPRGPCQPFYQVLLDSAEGGSFPVAYVAEDQLILPSEPTT